MYQFYASKIPEEIASRRSFEDRRNRRRKIRVIYTWKMMRFRLNDCPTTQQFPDHLHNGQLRLATTYRLTQVMMKMAQRSKFRYRHCLQVDENIWSWDSRLAFRSH
ncbi:DUF3418 domain-containing protein [Acinetobacter baumannii]